jgi:hypothetical protein
MRSYAAEYGENAVYVPFPDDGPRGRVMVVRESAPAAVRGSPGGGGGLAAWAEQSGHRKVRGPACGCLRFAFYGRVSTEDWQDPVTSRIRQWEQAGRWPAGTGPSRRSSSMWGRAGRWRGRGARRRPPCKPAKHELGWADFQVRSEQAIVRHWQLVMLAFTFSLLATAPAEQGQEAPPGDSGTAAGEKSATADHLAVHTAAGPQLAVPHGRTCRCTGTAGRPLAPAGTGGAA